MIDFDKVCRTAREGVKKAGEKIMQKFDGEKGASIKGYKDFVTSVDVDSENVVTEVISRVFPDHAILGEEKGRKGESDLMWIVDPLDSTNNYVFGIPFFEVAVALAFKEKLIYGLVYNPLTRELFEGIRGNGAFLNGTMIAVSKRSKLCDSMILYDNQFYKRGDMMANFEKLAKAAFTVRILGCAQNDICYTAVGKADARIFHRTKLCDWAAGAVILEEAGGTLTDFKGNAYNLDTTEIIASNGRIHKELIEILRG